MVLSAVSAVFAASVAMAAARADVIDGTLTGNVSQSLVDSQNLFGLGSSTNVNGQAVSGGFHFDLAALSPVSVIPQSAGQTDYSWTNSTGAVSITLITGATVTTITSSVSGGVYRADRFVNGIYQLYEVYADNGSTHAELYFVSPTDFLGAGSTTTPDYAFTLPNVANTLIGNSYLTVGGEQVVFAATSVETTLTVPEPSTLALFGVGVTALAFLRRRPLGAQPG
jgi:hypothetical protein